MERDMITPPRAAGPRIAPYTPSSTDGLLHEIGTLESYLGGREASKLEIESPLYHAYLELALKVYLGELRRLSLSTLSTPRTQGAP